MSLLPCLLVLSSLQAPAIVAASAAAGGRPPAMFVFGDSTLDVGNNNYLAGPGVPQANKPYYGIDFPGSVPTGRFSNGYNIADYLAKSMGFASSPPPYLSLAPSTGRLVLTARGSGVSYASGGAGILDSTNAGNNIPLSKQVQYFKSTKAQLVTKLGSRATHLLLSRSVFLFSVGSNDLFVFATAQASAHNNKSAADQQRDVATLYASLISNYSATITELHTMGARKFAIINVGLLGCVPVARLSGGTKTGACLDGLNELASGLDDALAVLLASLASRLPGFTYSLADYYGLSMATFDDPGASGYTDVADACCGGGRFGAEADCLPNATVCSNRDQHAFWDRVHPCQRGAMLTAQNFYDSRPGRYTAPINFKQLASTSL
ncbi:GDSL esterase/lipase [Zea mays]|uniref:GDSL esterase/lipase n=2 Tax=Zea mays TaxID=4577 RepID=B4FHS3_MAIZE|nr:GDSL esterase/lipase At5g55050-like precursor [Zea mays]ACF81666.1 unknown [Zea mays]ONM54032.1 GDSL esterase/lipase [Zea mays]PWZ13057.1 GDSL esterase/lipase [Zea mays]|eukprot:NP_001132708.1 uncharacterized protein LOC100194191 precursor [Zea mays]